MVEKLPLGGVVTLAPGKELFCRVLPFKEERALSNELARKVKAKMGAGGYFAANRGLLAWLREEKMTAEFSIAANRFAEMEATGELPMGNAVELYRASKDGVATEIFYRTRQSHPEVSLKDLEAVITETNAVDLHLELLRVLEGAGPSGNESTH